MAQGNPNKVNAIVDEIVENNKVFKLKTPIEQDKEKDSLAQSINSALSVLNEVGKELVLQELSVDPDEKFKGFIDSVGNIDISGLTQMTATIVKAKIEEAEREGIDLRQGQPVFKDNTKALLVGGVLTVAVIDTMIRDFEKLSSNERESLMENLEEMTFDQRKNLANSMKNTLKNIRDEFSSDEDKKAVDAMINVNTKNSNETDEYTSEEAKFRLGILKQQRGIEWYKSFIKRYNLEKFVRNGDYVKIFRLYEDEGYKLTNSIIEKGEKGESLSPEEREAANSFDKDYQAMEIIYKHIKELGLGNNVQEANIVIKEMSKENYALILKKASKLERINYHSMGTASIEVNNNVKHDINEKDGRILQKETISQEIEQLPNALKKANFSQEDIVEAMKQYRDYISNYSEISEEVADSIKQSTSDEIVLNIQDDFNSLKEDGQINSNVHQILNILAQVNYGNSMQQILTNSKVREQFLAQFDKVIEQGISFEQDVKLDGELAQIFSQYFKDNAEEMDISAIEEQKEQVTDEQVKQEGPKEMFSFIDSEYLKQDSIEGLIPRNGENSRSLQDDKKAIFYSQGKEGAIVMYFEFLKQYERLRGSAGDKALEQYANYKNGTIELSDEQVQLLQGQLKQITQMRETKDFDEFMGDKLYLKLNGIDTEQDRQTAEEWRASHPGSRMDYNYANSWTNSAISPDRIDVVSLQSKDGKDVRTSQKDLIKYFLSQTSIDKIEELGVNDTTLENIRKYYQEHSAEIAQMGEEYSVVTQNIQEFEQSRESKETEKQSETRETEITAPEIEKHEENLPAKQDNSFLGKIKRVFANMKDMKNKDNSKGFFARLGASIQTVFGNKKDEFDEKQDENITLNSTQRKEQTREDSKQTNYLTQHFDVNEKQAVQDLKKKQDSKDKDSQLSQDDQEFGNL